MKVIMCDVCGEEIKKFSSVVIPRNYWVNFVSTYIGKHKCGINNRDIDLCNQCYLTIIAFIDLLTKNEGNIIRMFKHQVNPIPDILQDYVRRNILKEY